MSKTVPLISTTASRSYLQNEDYVDYMCCSHYCCASAGLDDSVLDRLGRSLVQQPALGNLDLGFRV